MSAADVVAMRPFVPAKEFEVSSRFYGELGFAVRQIAPGLAAVELGGFGFLLQAYEAKGFAENFMMQLLVNDLETWWTRIAALKLEERYALCWAPRAPAVQPWGLTVAYVADPGGVLWHFVQKPAD